MKSFNDMYRVNMIIRKMKHVIKDREFNGSCFCYKDVVCVYLIRKDGIVDVFYFENSIEFVDMYLSILKYLAEHGGTNQWQIPKN